MQNISWKYPTYLPLRLLTTDSSFQAATAHSFGLAEDLALQSVTSVPARSMEIDHRVGYIKPGYDADIVLWDSHPLSVGATPLQVFIDGKDILDPAKVESSRSEIVSADSGENSAPATRFSPSIEIKELTCNEAEKSGAKLIITGITKSFLDGALQKVTSNEKLTMVIDGGKVVCFNSYESCISASTGGLVIDLKDGHVLPGLTAVSVALGLAEIASDATTGDGTARTDKLDLEDLVYAKYGVHLNGKAFARARIGGVTKAITAPISRGFAAGVSVAIKTNGKKNALNGGIFQDDVALHFRVGQASKSIVYS